MLADNGCPGGLQDATEFPRPKALSPQQLTATPRPLPNGVLAK